MKSDTSQERRAQSDGWLYRHSGPLLCTGAALLLTLLLFAGAWQSEKSLLEAALARMAAERILALEGSLRNSLSDLRLLGGLLKTSEEIDRIAFRNFARPLTGGDRRPSFRHLAWAPRNPLEQRQEFEDADWSEVPGALRITEGHPGRGPLSERQRRRYYPLLFVEPSSGYESALGYDLASLPAGRDALRRARESDRPVAADPSLLTGEPTEEADILFLLHVRRNPGEGPASTGEGVVIGALSLHSFFAQSNSLWDSAGLDLQIYDDSRPAGKELLYTHLSRRQGDYGPMATEPPPDLVYSRTLQVADLHWRIVCTPTPLFMSTYGSWLPEAILAIGLLFSLFLAIHLRSLSARWRRRRRESEKAVAEMDRLRRERDRSRQSAEHHAAEEHSVRSLIEMLPHGVAVCNSAGIVTFSNPSWDRLFGSEGGKACGLPVWALAADPKEREDLRDFLQGLVHGSISPEPRRFHAAGDGGGLRELRLDWDYLPGRGEQLAGYSLVLTDITPTTDSISCTGPSPPAPERLPGDERFPVKERVLPQRPQPSPETEEKDQASSSPRILLVEDNPVNLQVAEAMVANLGFSVDSATGGLEALDRVSAARYDLILMDCQMADLDGYKATEEIRRRESKENAGPVPIVAVTAHAFDEDRKRCFAAGMNDYLSKPFTQRQIEQILRRWLPEEETSAEREGGQERPAEDVAQGPLDRKVIERLRSLHARSGGPILPRLIALYLEDSPGLVEQIGTAAKAMNKAAIVDGAHSLKSSSANVGADRLAKLCRDLEAAARKGRTVGIAQQAAEVAAEYERVRHALEKEAGPECT